MEKTLAGIVAGIFVGAVAMEILNRKKPGLTKKVEKKTKDAVGAFVTAFKEGYEVEKPVQAAA